jgi:hypothetical protein
MLCNMYNYIIEDCWNWFSWSFSILTSSMFQLFYVVVYLFWWMVVWENKLVIQSIMENIKSSRGGTVLLYESFRYQINRMGTNDRIF